MCEGKQPIFTPTNINWYSPSHDVLGRGFWALEHPPAVAHGEIFILHSMCCIELFLPKHEEVDSHQAARVAWPSSVLPGAAAQKKQQKKNKSNFASVMCYSASHGQARACP